MAVVIDQDLTYSGSNLISAFNPNVLLFHSDTTSAEDEATAEVDIKYSIGFGLYETITFDAVMLEKVGSLFYFKLDITNILPSLLIDLSFPDNEIIGSNNSSLSRYDYWSMFRTFNITIRIQIPSEALETTTPYDVIACRSVNQIGDNGGSNLYDLYNLDTRPIYHIWDGMTSQFSIYLRSTEFITSVTFNRAIDDISEEDLSTGFACINASPDMSDIAEQVTNGDFADWTGSVPDGWSVVDSYVDNYISEESGKLRIVSDGYTDVGIKQDIDFKVGDNLSISFDVVSLSSSVTLAISDGTRDHIYYEENISSGGTKSFNCVALGDDISIYVKSDADIVIDNFSVKLYDTNQNRQEVTMTANDDGGERKANVVIHKGCEDGLNVRYLSRDYGVRYWQFSRIYQESNKYSEIGRVINNIDDMNSETRRENTIGINSTPSISCVYPKANLEEQIQLKQIYSSPQVEAFINGVWIGVFPSGGHTINTKKNFQDVRITFELPKEYTQRP